MCGFAEVGGAGEVAGYDFVECRRCALVFAPELTRAAMAELYEAGYHGPDDGGPRKGWANLEFLGPALERLETRESLRILDFGTGQSLVPHLLRERGHRVTAIDVAPPVRLHPDRLTGDLLDARLDPDQFDLVYSFQVFEHLPEPRPYLEELLRLAKPGALVLIHTDMEVPERENGLQEWWYVLPPDHCVFYRHRTFEVFVEGTPHRIAGRDPKSVLLCAGSG